MSYKPVGGVRRVSLHSADTVGLQSSGIEVELVDDSSRYCQQLSVEGGVATVIHRLSLTALCYNAEPWLNEEFIERCAQDGVVAKVEMNDTRHLTVGYSDALQFEQPLRLESIVVDSALSAADTPTVTLTLLSQNSTINQS